MGASPSNPRLRAGFALLVIVLAFNSPGTMSAEPDTDRSLTADKPPVTEPEPQAATGQGTTPPLTNAPPASDAIGDDLKISAGDTNAGPDLSSLTREQLEARVKALSEDLAAANTEDEFFRQQWQELRLRDEALGVEALTHDESLTEDKLVQAVKELYQSEMKRREAMVLLDKLLATTAQMIQTAPKYDPKVRSDYEVASRAAKDYLAGRSGTAIPIGSSLTDAEISDVNPELNAVIVNIGKSQGVREGMSFLIYRDDQQVGTVKVVLARDQVSAALVESLQSNVVLKVGDKVTVENGQ
jgi:hypothetical protein